MVIRIWMRARTVIARNWDRDSDRPAIYGGSGKGAQRAAWQAALNPEAAHLNGLKYTQVLLDLVLAFEMIPHCRSSTCGAQLQLVGPQVATCCLQASSSSWHQRHVLSLHCRDQRHCNRIGLCNDRAEDPSSGCGRQHLCVVEGHTPHTLF